MKRLATLCMFTAAILSAPLAAAANDWPNRPVRIVNTFAAGGAADILARLVADHLSTAFGQQFFVETRAGAGGAIGVQSVIATPPDGYNFVITNVSLLALRPVTEKKLGYDPVRDLTNIAYIAGSPVVLSVNAGGGPKTLPEFLARAKPGGKPLTYSSSGVGSMGHLVAETFAHEARANIEHVPYKGAAQGLGDLVGGHIDFSSQTVSSTASHLQSGTLRGLATSATERLPDYPDLPTFKELGYPNTVATIWFSLSAPTGLPKEIVQKVNREVAAAMSTPVAQKRLRTDGLVMEAMSVERFAQFIEEEAARWKPAIERAGLVGK